jgi:serine/threonine protein kinase
MRQVGSRYLLSERLGRGASGEVWRARTVDTDETVAVKVLRGELADDEQIVERFVRERALLLGFAHPGLVKVRDLVVEGDTLAIVMDLIDGGDLRRYLRERGRLDPCTAVAVVRQVLRALAAVHTAGVVHRDVKPENILIASPVTASQETAPRAYLTDFGIARLAHGPAITRLSGLIGTPLYMAPELAGDVTAGPAADVYAAGVVLYELLAGEPPFQAGNPVAVLMAHAKQPPPVLSDLPPGLWPALATMLAKAPDERPTDALAADRALSAIVSDSDLAGVYPPDAADTVLAGSRRLASVGAGETRLAPTRPGSGPPWLSNPPGGTKPDGTGLGSMESGGVPSWPGEAAGDQTLIRTPAATPAAAPARRSRRSRRSSAGRRVAVTAGVLAAILGSGLSAWALGLHSPTANVRTVDQGVAAAPRRTTPSPSLAAATPSARPSAPPLAAVAPISAVTASPSASPTAARPTQPTDGRVTVPQVVGLTIQAASSTLANQGFGDVRQTTGCFGGSAAGTVIRQSPAAGSRVMPGSDVRLRVQADCATVPDVRGMAFDDATNTLRSLGFTNIPYVYECYGSPRLGTVVRQSPGPGTTVTTDQPVNLYLQANNCG